MPQRLISDWQKGGLRYAKLKRVVPEFLAPVRLDAFFVAVRSRGGRFRLFNPFTPLQREYVIAATNENAIVLSCGGRACSERALPASVFRSRRTGCVLPLKTGR